VVEEVTFGLVQAELEATVIHCDNQSCIKLSENPSVS
jgi:hypothetical protein